MLLSRGGWRPSRHLLWWKADPRDTRPASNEPLSETDLQNLREITNNLEFRFLFMPGEADLRFELRNIAATRPVQDLAGLRGLSNIDTRLSKTPAIFLQRRPSGGPARWRAPPQGPRPRLLSEVGLDDLVLAYSAQAVLDPAAATAAATGVQKCLSDLAPVPRACSHRGRVAGAFRHPARAPASPGHLYAARAHRLATRQLRERPPGAFLKPATTNVFYHVRYPLGLVVISSRPLCAASSGAAPLIARDLETGDLPSAWNQSITRHVADASSWLIFPGLDTSPELALMHAWADPISRPSLARRTFRFQRGRSAGRTFATNGITPSLRGVLLRRRHRCRVLIRPRAPRWPSPWPSSPWSSARHALWSARHLIPPTHDRPVADLTRSAPINSPSSWCLRLQANYHAAGH